MSIIPRFSGILFLATTLAMFSLPAQALTISFSPDADLDNNSGAYSELAIDFGVAIGSVFADQPIGTPNSAWITSGGAINIGAGQQISATDGGKRTWRDGAAWIDADRRGPRPTPAATGLTQPFCSSTI